MALEFPPLYLLAVYFKDISELTALGKKIGVVFNAKEKDVKVFLAHESLKAKARIRLELRKIGVLTEEVVKGQAFDSIKEDRGRTHLPPQKRRKVEKIKDGKDVINLDSDSDIESEPDINTPGSFRTAIPNPSSGPSDPSRTVVTAQDPFHGWDKETIKVLKLAWYEDSVKAGKLLPIGNYLLYEGRITSTPKSPLPIYSKPAATAIVIRPSQVTRDKPYHKYRHGKTRSNASHFKSQTPQLLHESTSDHEYEAELPDVPDNLKQRYSCKRRTPLHTPNDDFIAQLKLIEAARRLTDDDESTSSYSDLSYSIAISAIAAYPWSIGSPGELLRLKGVGPAVANYFNEWRQNGCIQEVEYNKKDERMCSWSTFDRIFEVGPGTARRWYNNGWRDLDDVSENFQLGLANLSRSQEIGLKYYDEFEEKIPRDEVERIGAIVLNHANEICPGFEMVICGGYRRGKPNSGDVDVMLTHRDEDLTLDFIDHIVTALENSDYITHTLIQSNRNSERGQETLAWKGAMRKQGRKAGFDTLDKVFVAWQDPEWPTKNEDLAMNSNAKNPNPHRRVDIIITPWKTAGCAIVGWSGATMFERDLRRYCRDEIGYKFDSSGVRRLDNGDWVDLEAGADTLLEKEKKVFEGLGLDWIEPTERCTD